MVVDVNDRVLVDAARAGDLEAFEALVRRHEDRVYRVALRLLGSPADAEDAAQEAFVQAWRSLRRFRGESAVSTWLYRIVTNRCLSLLEARRRDAEPLEASEPAVLEGPEEAAIAREKFAAVMRAVSRLPVDQRAALVLRDFEGLSYDEVAEVLQISLAAVKGRIHRARLAVLRESAQWQ